MAVALATDWIRTTSQVKHYGNLSYTAAVRTGWVTGLDGNHDDDGDAIAALVAAEGNYHHNETDLPLESVRSFKVGPLKCAVTATYGFGPSSIPLRSSLEMATPVDSTIQIPWWDREQEEDGDPTFDSDGLPNGPCNYEIYTRGAGIFTVFKPYVRTVGVTTWRVPFTLATDPAALVSVPTGRINDDAFTIKASRAQDTLQYRGMVYNVINSAKGLRYQGEYRFLFRAEKHLRQYVFATLDLSYTTFPLTRITRMYPRVTFAGMFPMNRGRWTTGTNYIVGDTVWGNADSATPAYKCLTSHTSSSANDAPHANWEAV